MKPLLILLLAALTFMAAPACRQAAESPPPAGYSVTDALGRLVHFREPPGRIALSGKALFMITDSLYMFPGAGRRIIPTERTGQGSWDFLSLIDPEISGKELVPETAAPEQIAALRPDAVVLKSYLAQTLGRPLELLDLPVVYVDFETPDQYLRDLRTLGQLLEQTGRADELIRYFQSGMDRVRNAVAEVPPAERRRVLLLYYSNRQGTGVFNIPPRSWMQTVMTEMAGGMPVWREDNPGKGWTQVSLEQIFAWDPDVIFVTSYAEDSSEVAGRLRNDHNWQAVRALRTGRLHAFAGDFHSWDQPDPRWILGLTWMAQKLYPDRFRGVDIIESAREFYRVSYGLDAAFFDSKIRPALRGELP